MSILKALGYAWSAPTTILALIFWFFPMWAAGQMKPLRIKDGVWDWVIVPGSRWGNYYSPTPAKNNVGWIATTLGWAIMWSDTYQDIGVYRNHELRHVQQAMAFGPAWLPLYLILEGIFGYTNDAFEVDARAHEMSGPYPVTDAQGAADVTAAKALEAKAINTIESPVRGIETEVNQMADKVWTDVKADYVVAKDTVVDDAKKAETVIVSDAKEVESQLGTQSRVVSAVLCGGPCPICDVIKAEAKKVETTVVADVKSDAKVVEADVKKLV